MTFAGVGPEVVDLDRRIAPTSQSLEIADAHGLGEGVLDQLPVKVAGALDRPALLLHSDGGVLRLMPAWPRDWDVNFQLLAKGGFFVSSSMKGGKIRFVEILSQLGGECRIRNPWPGSEVTVLAGGKKTAFKDPLLKFPTVKGKSYVLVCGAENLSDLKAVVP